MEIYNIVQSPIKPMITTIFKNIIEENQKIILNHRKEVSYGK